MLLSDLGCEVIKIEEPQKGDYMRWVPPFIGEESALFLAVNRNKKSMTLNLKSPQGKKIFFKLIAQSDVVVESFRPGIMETLNIGYEKAREINPEIIYCSITAYGQNGPYKSKAAHDINVIGVAGILGLTEQKALPGIQIADLTSSLMSCIAILGALRRRDRTAQGQFIDISMLDSVVSLLATQVSVHQALDTSPAQPQISLSGELACYALYETKDGKVITLAAIEPKFWKQFCELVERPELIDKQFSQDQELLKKHIRATFAQKTQKEWLKILKDVCTPLNSMEEVIKDPQLLHRNMILHLHHPTAGDILQIANPLITSFGPVTSKIPPPLFGEHTDSILKDLGYSDSEITDMRERGII
jgi:crotonobetainyl-CoA:carnitine CoA-transferase CaiB-like acyl-CoA transferase